MVVGDVEQAPVSTVGPAIENHPAFPERVNVGFLQAVSRTEGKLRVWERGADETLACGTAPARLPLPVCAADSSTPRSSFRCTAAACVLSGWHADRLRLPDRPAATVFTGEIDVPAI